jgi:transposase-like protein
VLDRLSKRVHSQAHSLLLPIPCAKTLAEAAHHKQAFQAWCNERDFARAGQVLNVDWERMASFYRYPKENWVHIRTTQVVQSPFLAVRLFTDAAKRYQKVESATAVIWRLLMVAEQTFRRLNAPEHSALLAMGAEHRHGVLVHRAWKKVAT